MKLMGVIVPFQQISNTFVSWVPPEDIEIKVNVDRSRVDDPLVARFGGVLRNNSREWIVRFSGFHGLALILSVKLHGIKHGLLQAYQRGFHRVWCKSDSTEALRLISLPSVPWFHPLGGVLADIREIISRD